jgi:hypothetical protein
MRDNGRRGVRDDDPALRDTLDLAPNKLLDRVRLTSSQRFCLHMCFSPRGLKLNVRRLSAFRRRQDHRFQRIMIATTACSATIFLSQKEGTLALISHWDEPKPLALISHFEIEAIGSAGRPKGSRRGRTACRTRRRALGRRGQSGAACRRTRAAWNRNPAPPRTTAARPL